MGLLGTGFEALIARCQEKLQNLDIEKDDYVEKREFYLSCAEAMGAVILYANRFANLAETMAEKEPDEKRKKELLQIASNCRNVPAKPASSYWEALQFLYSFSWLSRWRATVWPLASDEWISSYILIIRRMRKRDF